MYLSIYMYIIIYKAENCTFSMHSPYIGRFRIVHTRPVYTNFNTLLNNFVPGLFFFPYKADMNYFLFVSLTFFYSNERWIEIDMRFRRKLCCSQLL